jgi:hypothetical protein
VVYRDAGLDRSLEAVGRKLHKSVTLLGRWSSRHEWVARAAAWDEEQDRVRRARALAEVARLAERHAREAQALQVAALAAVRAALKRLLPGGDLKAALAEMEPAELLRLIPGLARVWADAVEAERLARGIPTDYVATHELSERGLRAEQEWAERIAQDAGARRAAAELLARIYGDGDGAGGA